MVFFWDLFNDKDVTTDIWLICIVSEGVLINIVDPIKRIRKLWFVVNKSFASCCLNKLYAPIFSILTSRWFGTFISSFWLWLHSYKLMGKRKIDFFSFSFFVSPLFVSPLLFRSLPSSFFFSFCRSSARIIYCYFFVLDTNRNRYIQCLKKASRVSITNQMNGIKWNTYRVRKMCIVVCFCVSGCLL